MSQASVILTENIPSLGAESDLVKVRRGYARNFLLPRGKAVEANGASAKLISHLQAKRAEREAREVTEAEELGRKINKIELAFELEYGQAGKAFGSVTAKDITERLIAQLKDVDLARHAVILERPIKESGTHEVSVKLHPEVTAKVKVTIKAPVAPAEASPEDRPQRRSRKPAEETSTEE